MKPSQALHDCLLILAGGGATLGLWYAMFGWWGMPAALVLVIASGVLAYLFTGGSGERGEEPTQKARLRKDQFRRIDRQKVP